MKYKLLIPALAFALSIPTASAFAQDDEPQLRETGGYYELAYFKVKSGKMGRFREITGMFIQAEADAGNPPPFELFMMTGEWNVVVAFPLTGGIEALAYTRSAQTIRYRTQLERIAGGKPEMAALFQEFGTLIESSQNNIGYLRK
ncbi:hypothetical protein [Altererythrobacter sp. ZODW24]|uniref:hypothetical protein n=1 Tax=Altererythrobacter sp. ZODW24 TaxID=2185142 RepID=UPI000DF8483B|nr:hypothetical protein [Altererythrobacter sp. ZODW24]